MCPGIRNYMDRKLVLAFNLLTILFLGWQGQSVAQETAKSGWFESGPEANGNKAQVNSKTGGVTLQIGVEHSNHVKPIPLNLQIGSIFDDRILKARHKLSWYRIPEWLAGKWKRDRECIVSSYDHITNQRTRMDKSILSEQMADWGVQRDKEGGIWHCNLSNRGMSNRGSFRSIALVRRQMPIKEDRASIVFKEQFVVLNVMKGTNAIMDSYIVESITKYKPIKRGLLETMMSVQVYLADGTPKKQQENMSFDKLVTPYTSVNSYKGIDVKSDFDLFLKSRNLEHLIVE